MASNEKLLPCPFCGEGEHLLVERLEGTTLHPAHQIRCDNCGASAGYTDRDFRAKWNARATFDVAQQAAPSAPAGNHTPEPWRASNTCELDSGRVVQTVMRGDDTLADVFSTDAKANARRIVACVNACAGIPTEHLEGASFAVYDNGGDPSYELERDP